MIYVERKLELKEGQKVFVKIQEGSNKARNINMTLENIDDWCFEGLVTKVGRKYISVKFRECIESQFIIDENYKQREEDNYILYLTKDEVLEEKEIKIICEFIRKYFDGYTATTLTLNQLKAIKNIIDTKS